MEELLNHRRIIVYVVCQVYMKHFSGGEDSMLGDYNNTWQPGDQKGHHVVQQSYRPFV